jgi:hypothetical protein
MEYWKRSNGWLTFFENWWLPLTAMLVLAASQVPVPSHMTFWIGFFATSFTLMILGGSLIGYAKFPVYRSGHFLTFGLKSVPQNLARHYRVGWWIFLLGVMLALCLLSSNP